MCSFILRRDGLGFPPLPNSKFQPPGPSGAILYEHSVATIPTYHFFYVYCIRRPFTEDVNAWMPVDLYIGGIEHGRFV